MRNRLFTLFGGTGFIGRYVVERLADRGARILVISRSPNPHGRHLQPLGAVDQIVVRSVDLSSEAALRQAVAGAAGVISLIGILYETGRQQFAEVQGALPGRIAAAALAEGVPRLVHLSAIGADRASASAYARSKAEGERRVREAFPDAAILRPSVVIGPEDGFFNRFAALARMLPALPLIGGGQTRFQPVYVGDIAFVYLLQSNQTVALQPINVGTTDGNVSEVRDLKPGAVVAADNFNRLSDGAKVSLRSTGRAAQSGAPNG